ncbi:apolipoprotein N-acyltransferase [Hyphomonas sp. FCG-A18]|uniref:apolipoprotein N-acyltransferase n=1 Tax=Hyphomonas sp. FCG-A18 TaxID=3080019 RepID=UPI002B324242|nr:apolipoprotein N-acyltransferase [Hyphomonas sp. FCG-A18]
MSEARISHGFGPLTSLYEAVARTGGLTGMLFAALLGAFAALGFAPFHLSPTLAIAFIGLVWMLDGARGHKRWGRSMFARGWAFGFGFFLVGMYWTAQPFLVEPERHAIFLWMPLIALPGGMALIWGAACALGGAFWSSSPSRVFIFALFMGLAELARGHLFGGFPWNLAGTTWTPGAPLSQAASLGGVYWLTLVTLLIMAAPATLVDTRAQKGVLLRAVPSVLAIALLAFGWAWGSQRLATDTELTERSVILIDAGVPQAEKFENPQQVLARYSEFLREIPSEPGDILIWPEGALPSYLLQDTVALDQISGFLGPRTLITGTPRVSTTSGAANYYNSVAVFQTGALSTELVALYDKHRLVPFGELAATRIVPFGESISGILPSAIQRMARSGFTPGAGPTVLYPETLPAFIPLICYEGLFPEMLRKADPRPENAEWIVVVSNDAWFGGGMGPAQHYNQNRYRAIESGLPMARVATRGTTAMIDGYGRELARGNPVAGDPAGWRSSVVRTALPAKLDRTPYQRFGGTFYWLSLVVCLILAFACWRR